MNDIQSSLCVNCRKPVVKKVMKPRLPLGSKFGEMEYTESGWTNWLQPNHPGCPRFEATESSVNKLLYALDDMYREWLKGQA